MYLQISFCTLAFTTLCAISIANGYTWEEKWYSEMPIDHFNYNNINGTFKLRYLVNLTHWNDGKDNESIGPIFFYCGNEGGIDLFAKNTGFMWDVAERLNGAVVFAEHRYYGKSMPYGSSKEAYSSLEKLGTLSAEQALADFAVLISALKDVHASPLQEGTATHRLSNSSLLRGAPVVAFGGSYGGMLAAWFRIKYPHIVAGALASSAPIRQYDVDCGTYDHIVTKTFANAVPGCDKIVKKFWSAAQKLVDTKKLDAINKGLKLCDDSQLKSGDSPTTLFNWLYGILSEMPMVDYPYPTEFIAPVPAKPVTATCKILTSMVGKNASEADYMNAMGEAIGVFLNYTEGGAKPKKCYNTKADVTPDLGTDGWNFQLCTDQTQPWCSRPEDMFMPFDWNLTSFSENCARKYYGVVPRPQWIAQYFGWEQVKTSSNIFFSNGELDPWSGGGILPKMDTELNNALIQTILIPDAAHHYDLRGKHDKDTAAVIATRLLEEVAIMNWIDYHAGSAALTGSVLTILLVIVADLLISVF